MGKKPDVISIMVPLGDPLDNAAKVMGRLLVSDPAGPAQILYTPAVPAMASTSRVRVAGVGKWHLPLTLKKILFALALLFVRGRMIHTLISPRPAMDHLLRRLAKKHDGRVIQTVPVVVDGSAFAPRAFFGDVIVVFSDYSRRVLQKHGIGDIRVAPIPCDTRKFHPGPYPSWTSPRMLVCEEFSRPQTFTFLLSAAGYVNRKIPGARFVLAARIKERADRKLRKPVLETLRQSGLGSCFEIHETVPDMPALIRSCHLTVYPVDRLVNKLDFPLFVLEGLAMGRPAVISDIPPLNELWPHPPLQGDACGIKVPAGDPAALAEAIVALLRDPQKLEKCGNAGIRLINGRHRVEDFRSFYTRLFKEMTG